MINGFVNVGGNPAHLVAAGSTSASATASLSHDSTPRAASFNDELLELWEKALTTLCDFKPWLVFHQNRIGEALLQQQSSSQKGKPGSSAGSVSKATHNDATQVVKSLSKSDVKILEYCAAVGEALTTSLFGILKCIPKDEPSTGSSTTTFRGKLSSIAGALMKGRPTGALPSVDDSLAFAKLVAESLQQVSDVFSGSRKKPKR
jgi:hypothetical protein